MTGTGNNFQVETTIPIREVMRHHPTTIDSGATVSRAAAKMCRGKSGSCIVLQNNNPIGIITEEDINCKVVAKGMAPNKVAVKDVMTSPLITIGIEKNIGEAAHMMVEKKVRRLPVIESDGSKKVIGILTVRDLFTVSTEMNEIMSDLIDINRVESYEIGTCERCGQMSDALMQIDGQLICQNCRDDDSLL